MKKKQFKYIMLLFLILIMHCNMAYAEGVYTESKVINTTIKIEAEVPKNFNLPICISFLLSDGTNETYELNKENNYCCIGDIDVDNNIQINFIKIVGGSSIDYFISYDTNEIIDTKPDIINNYKFSVVETYNAEAKENENKNTNEIEENKEINEESENESINERTENRERINNNFINILKNVCSDIIIILIILIIYLLLKRKQEK